MRINFAINDRVLHVEEGTIILQTARDTVLQVIPEILDFTHQTLNRFRTFLLQTNAEIETFDFSPTSNMGLVADNNTLGNYDGQLLKVSNRHQNTLLMRS